MCRGNPIQRHPAANQRILSWLKMGKLGAPKTSAPRFLLVRIFAVLAAVCVTQALVGAREKNYQADPNDVTGRLFQLLDDTHEGKLTDCYLLADLYKGKDLSTPDEEFQHVLHVDYDKNRGFGKLNLHVRTLAKLAPEQESGTSCNLCQCG